MLKDVEPGTKIYEETCTNRKYAGLYRNPIFSDEIIVNGLAKPLMERAGRTKTFFEKIVKEDLARYDKLKSSYKLLQVTLAMRGCQARCPHC